MVSWVDSVLVVVYALIMVVLALSLWVLALTLVVVSRKKQGVLEPIVVKLVEIGMLPHFGGIRTCGVVEIATVLRL